MRLLLVLVLLLPLTMTAAPYDPGQFHFVNSKHGLKVRTLPAQNARISFTLPDGELVSYLGEYKEMRTGTLKGYWLRIAHGERTGWAFSSFLAEVIWEKNAFPPEGIIFQMLTFYNRRTRQGVLNFQKGMVGSITPEEFSRSGGRIHIRLVMPPAAYIHCVLEGPLAGPSALSLLASGKNTDLHFRILEAKEAELKPEGISLFLRMRVESVVARR